VADFNPQLLNLCMNEYYEDERRKEARRKARMKKHQAPEGKLQKFSGWLQTPFRWDYHFQLVFITMLMVLFLYLN